MDLYLGADAIAVMRMIKDALRWASFEPGQSIPGPGRDRRVPAVSDVERPAVTVVSDGRDEPVVPLGGALHVAFIALQLQLVFLTTILVQCGPLHGVLALLWFLISLAPITIPLEVLMLGAPGLVAFLVLRHARRTGRSRVSWRVQMTVLAVLTATMLTGLIFALSGHGSAWCSFD